MNIPVRPNSRKIEFMKRFKILQKPNVSLKSKVILTTMEQLAIMNKASSLLEKLTGQKLFFQVKNHTKGRTVRLDIELTKLELLDTISQVYWTKTKTKNYIQMIAQSIVDQYMVYKNVEKGKYVTLDKEVIERKLTQIQPELDKGSMTNMNTSLKPTLQSKHMAFADLISNKKLQKQMLFQIVSTISKPKQST